MKHLRLISAMAVLGLALAAAAASLFSLQSRSKTKEKNQDAPQGVAAPPPADPERRERFVIQFGEDQADVAMAEADRLFGGIFELLNGPISIQGTIRAEDGSDVGPVRVRVGVSVASMSWDPEGEEYDLVAEGDFLVEVENASNVQLQFDAQGYYTRILDWDREFDHEGYRRLIEGGAIGLEEDGTLVVEGVDVVLEPKGEIVALRNFGGIMRTIKGEAPSQGIDLSLAQNAGTGSSMLSANCQIETWPTDNPIVAVNLPKNDDGPPFAWVEFDRDQKFKVVVPERAEIVMPEGWSIQRFDYEHEDGDIYRAYHYMQTAPEEGYLPVLALSAEDMNRLAYRSPLTDGLFFFFQSPLGYGKGRITGVNVDLETGEVGIGIQLRLQTDGSRNLESGE